MQLTTTNLSLCDLPRPAFNSVKKRLAWMESIEAAPKVTKMCEAIAQQEGVSRGTVYRIYNEWRRDGKSWVSLIDRRFMPDTWKRQEDSRLPHAFLNHFKALCEANQRSSASAYNLLLRQLEKWRRGTGPAIPGYDFPPDNQPTKNFPHGWGYKNLMNHQPTDIEYAAARLGRSQAKALTPSVMTTRVNMYPFAEIQFDDMWHDFLINVLGQSSARRLLEFGAVDYYSGLILPPGLKPRITDEATKKNRILNSGDFRFYLAFILTHFGFHPRGTILNVEHATASITPEMEESIRVLTGGLVTVLRSSMSGRSALVGGYSEGPKGNYKMKALKECYGNVIHNETAMLMGQVGMDRNHLPSENYGRNKENDLLLAIMTLKPHLAEKLRFGFLNYQEASQAIHEVYRRLNNRTQHRLEGFEEAGLVANEIRFSNTVDQWMPLSSVQQLPAANREAFAAMIQADESLRRSRLMSPQEVFEQGKDELVRLPFSALPNLLGKEDGVVKTVRQQLFHLEGKDTGERKFLAEVYDRSGMPALIPNGTKCRVYLNPFAPDRLIVADEKSNQFLGECMPWDRVDRTDKEAIHKMSGRAERVFNDAVMEAGLRNSRAKVQRQNHNAKVIREDCNGSERKISGLDSSALLTEERLEEPDFTETIDEGTKLL